MQTLTRPRAPKIPVVIDRLEARTALDRVAVQINQTAADWRAQIAARQLGTGRDPGWSAGWAAIEARLDRLFSQKRHLLMSLPHRVC